MKRESKIIIMSNGMKKTKTQNQAKENPPAETKNSQKNSEEKPTAGPPSAVQPAGSQPQTKKNKGCLTCGIIAVVVVVLLIVGFVGLQILSFWFPPTFLFGFLSQLKGLKSITDNSGSVQKGTLHGKNLAGLIDPSKTVTERITAKNGGRVTAQTANGLYFTLNIGSGSLEKDTDISITPISESPIENYPNPSDPGVVIGPPGTNLGDDSTVTVSEDPPATGPDGSGDPGAPPGTPPDVPPTAPPGTPPTAPPGTPPTAPPGTPPGTSGDIPDLAGLLGLLGKNTMTTTPSGNPSGQGSGATGNTGAHRNTGNGSSSGSNAGSPRFSATTVIIFVNYGGGVSPVPTDPSDDGDSATGPIDQTGGTTVDNPDEGEAEDLAKNAAAASGGTCSPEFIDAIKAMADIPDYPAGSIMARTLDDCLNLEWLRDKCQNNPIALRRLYFKERLRIAADLQAPAEKVEEINRLMNECVARYEISSSGSDPSLGVPMSATANLWVCGYLDDAWQGTMAYQIVPPGLPGAGHYFSGTVNSMNLPPRGGTFAAEATPDSHFGGAGLVDLSSVPLGLWGYFDGQSTLNPLNIYVVAVNSVPINMTQRPCVPLAPLSR